MGGRDETFWRDGADAAFYRYTVRCDRAFNAAIEKAAKKAGLSATSFVQRHFDTILGAVPPEPERAERNFEEPNRVRKPKRAEGAALTPAQEKVLAALVARADDRGHVSIGMELLARDAGTTPGSARTLIARLKELRLVTTIRRGGWQNPAVYRIRVEDEGSGEAQGSDRSPADVRRPVRSEAEGASVRTRS